VAKWNPGLQYRGRLPLPGGVKDEANEWNSEMGRIDVTKTLNFPPASKVERIMKSKRVLAISLGLTFGLAACNGHGAQSSSDFNAAGQALGNGNIGAGATDTGHAFSQGAQATGQAIGAGAQATGHAINNTLNGN
jgi:hypothetical protein